MHITRIYTGDDDESHFEDVELNLEDRGDVGRVSELVKVSGIMFRETDGSYDLDFHNAPRRQYVINLDGFVEIETGDGTKRVFGPGEVFLAEDTTGRGHISRAVDGQARRSIFVALD
jgi:hypothetical protein